jgi:hypothetical protein
MMASVKWYRRVSALSPPRYPKSSQPPGYLQDAKDNVNALARDIVAARLPYKDDQNCCTNGRIAPAPSQREHGTSTEEAEKETARSQTCI